MCIEWKGILTIAVILLVDLIIIKFIDKKKNLNPELKRKMFHMSMGLVMLTLPYLFTSWVSVGVLGIVALVFLFLLKNTKLKDSIGTVLYSVDRESLGEIFFAISVFIVFYWSKGDKVLFSIPILILTFADSTAALIGKNYGKKNIAEKTEDAKSIEGSFMFFMVAFLLSHIPMLLFTNVGREESLIIAAIVGFNVALIEMISHTGNDNLLIPVTTFAFVATHIGMSLMDLRIHLVILAIIFILGTIANRVKAWSKLALVEALVVGYLIVTLYGWYAMIPPLIAFLTVMRFPKRKDNEKDNLYDARIIETNVAIGTAICAIVAITGMEKELFMIYSVCYAMHFIVNTFVRFKYYVKFSEVDSILLSIAKGIGFVFLPSLILHRLVFGEFISLLMLTAMIIAMILSAIIIYIKKKNVKKEVISVKNGYMHARIVLVLTLILSLINYLEIIL